MWLIALVGCLSYEDGQARVGELSCELADTCGTLDVFGYDDVADCVTHAREQPWDEANCPDYDAAAMRGCIDAYEAAVDAADCAFVPGETCSVC